jgi:Tfp pilus assembly protein PilO
MNDRILPVLGLLIAVGIFFTYVQPMWVGSIKTLKDDIAFSEKALVAAQQYKEKQDTLMDARNMIDATQLARLETFLPDSVNNVRLILDLNALVARSGLSLSSINVTTSAKDSESAPDQNFSSRSGSANSLDISLTTVGTYGALKTFLKGVENSNRLLDVQSIAVRGSDTGVYNYQMLIRLYWLR